MTKFNDFTEVGHVQRYRPVINGKRLQFYTVYFEGEVYAFNLRGLSARQAFEIELWYGSRIKKVFTDVFNKQYCIIELPSWIYNEVFPDIDMNRYFGENYDYAALIYLGKVDE